MKRIQRNPVGLINRRALIVGGGMGAAFLVLGGRLHYLSVDQADEFRLLAEENRISIKLLAPSRGLIKDRNGVLIASNAPDYQVTITREGVSDVDTLLSKLALLIPLPEAKRESIKKELKKTAPFTPVTIAQQLTWEQTSLIALNTPALPGVSLELGLSRFYPMADHFAHIIGYVGAVSEKDIANESPPDPLLNIPEFKIGKIGIERWLEKTMRGTVGTQKVEVNSVGRVMRELERNDGDPGAEVRLTVDAGLQHFAQARLKDQAASAVVIDVQNGDVLAMASTPSFDPNLFVHGISHTDYKSLLENERHPLINKAVQGQYPPGSTFKMVTALAALRAGLISPQSRVYCPGYVVLGKRRFHCWKRHGHGSVDLGRSLEESCDVFYYETAQKVGIDNIAQMARELGLGVEYDLPLSSVAAGLMPNKEWKQTRYAQSWSVGDTLNASIGQGYVLSTPLQLAVMMARLASGREIQPRLIKAAAGAREQSDTLEPALLNISPQHLALIRAGMYDVINAAHGTARASRIQDPAFLWAGKTGTSQVRNITTAERAEGVVSNNDLPWNRRDHALFVGYAPYDNPRYAISIVVEHGGGGSTAAAPLARDILLYALNGGIPPLSSYPPEQHKKMQEIFDDLNFTPPAVGTEQNLRSRA